MSEKPDRPERERRKSGPRLSDLVRAVDKVLPDEMKDADKDWRDSEAHGREDV